MASARSLRSNTIHLSEADLRAKLLAPITEPNRSPPPLDRLPSRTSRLSPIALEFFPQVQPVLFSQPVYPPPHQQEFFPQVQHAFFPQPAYPPPDQQELFPQCQPAFVPQPACPPPHQQDFFRRQAPQLGLETPTLPQPPIAACPPSEQILLSRRQTPLIGPEIPQPSIRAKIIPSNAFKPYSGCATLCFENLSDGSQPLVDFKKQFASIYGLGGHPRETWTQYVEMHLAGMALQTARAALRGSPNLSWDALMDTLQETHVVRDEQSTLRTVLALLRPSNFPSLNAFVLEFKRLLSYVDTSFYPIPLVADMLVAALAGTQAGTAITQMEMDRGIRPSLTEMLKALTCMGHASSPRATRAPPVIMAAAGWSPQPTPASLPTLPRWKTQVPTAGCFKCGLFHWPETCPLPERTATGQARNQSTSQIPLRPPTRPCSNCGGNHWDRLCPTKSAESPNKRTKAAPPRFFNRHKSNVCALVEAELPYSDPLSDANAEYNSYIEEGNYLADQAAAVNDEKYPLQYDTPPDSIAFAIHPVTQTAKPEMLTSALINGIEFLGCLVDTGCQITALSEETAAALEVPICPSPLTVEVADGHHTRVSGTAEVAICIASSGTFAVNSIVLSGLRYPALIGVDFLSASKAIIKPSLTDFLSFAVNSIIVASPTVKRAKSDHPKLPVPCNNITTRSIPAYVFHPIQGDELVALTSPVRPDMDPVEVNDLLPEELRMAVEPVPKSVCDLSMKEFLQLIGPRIETQDPEQRCALLTLLSKHKSAFATTLADIEIPARVPQFLVETITDQTSLLSAKYRKRFALAELEAIEKQVDLWKNHGIVENCAHPNPVISNLITVPKSDGSRRVCVDPSPLNLATPLDATLTPDLRCSIEKMAGASLFSAFDLYAGYLQVPFDKAHRHKLAFTTSKGVFQPTRMFFGLKNACAHFCKGITAMETEEKLTPFLSAYFDDLTVFSSTFQEHLTHLDLFFTAIIKRGYKIGILKTTIAALKVKALGSMISVDGIHPPQSEMEAINRMPEPKSKNELRSFLGLCNYYRQYIESYATLAAPLSELTRENIHFAWSEQAGLAFNALKKALISPTVLALPVVANDFIIHSDASSIGIGGVVSQLFPSPSGLLERPVAFFSRSLSPAEQRYSITELELLAIVFLVAKVRHWILGKSTRIVTDHSALHYLLTAPDLKGRLARWKIALDQFDIVILYRKGILNGNADALSRLPSPFTPIAPPTISMNIAKILTASIGSSPGDQPINRRETNFRDPFYNSLLFGFIKTGMFPPSTPQGAQSRITKMSQHFRWSEPDTIMSDREDGVWKLVPRIPQRNEWIARSHLLGHFGIRSTYNRLVKNFKVTWPSMLTDVECFVRTCAPCITRLPTPLIQHPARALSIPGCFHRCALDLALGFPKTPRGNIGVLVIMEYLTKFPVCYPIQSKCSEEIAAKFLNFIAMFGPPLEILSDQGGEFVNKTLNSLCLDLGISKRVTSPYHPRVDGMVERFNRTLIRSLETLSSEHPSDWDLQLDIALMGYRSRIHSSTGFSPFELMFGRSPNNFLSVQNTLSASSSVTESLLQRSSELRGLVDDLVPKALATIEISQETQKQSQNSQFPVVSFSLPTGSVVYCINFLKRKKLEKEFIGPYKVLSQNDTGNYILVNTKGKQLHRSYPLDQLKLIDPTHADIIWATELNGGEFMVSRIIDHRRKASGKGTEYLVEWKGFDSEHNSWVLESDILDLELLTTYWADPSNPPTMFPCSITPPLLLTD